MICILLGLVPPLPEFWYEICTHVTSVAATNDDDKDDDNNDNTHKIAWMECSTAADTDTADHTVTLICTALTTASPEQVCVAVTAHLQASSLQSCEVWASAPAPLPLRPSEGYPVHYNEHVDDPVRHAFAVMQKWGILLQSNLIDTDGLAVIRQIVHDAISTTEFTLQQHHPNLQLGQDDILFQEIASRNVQRFDLRLQQPAAVDFVHDYLLSERKNNNVSQFLQETLQCTADEFDFDISVVYSKPGACAQNWHADGGHATGARDAGWRNDFTQTLAAPYAICLFVPLIDLNSRTGYTQFWPGSHRHRDLVGFGPIAALTGATVGDDAQQHGRAGDGIWYDYRLLHRGMPNTTANTLRPILQVVFKRKWHKERNNYGTISMMDHCDTERTTNNQHQMTTQTAETDA